MWRWLVPAAVLAAGCVQSDAQALSDLEARAMSCGVIDDNCVARTPASSVVDCLNNALRLGQVASTSWTDYDRNGDLTTHYMFTDGSDVRQFYQEPDGVGKPDKVTELGSCSGPVLVEEDAICGNLDAPTTNCFF